MIMQAGTQKLSSTLLSLTWLRLAIYRMISMSEGYLSSGFLAVQT